jgi:5-methylcytosine-specific restriction endonuclease McrA
MQRVFVLDKNKKPLMPCKPARANRLLDSGKAKVYRLCPFTIILTQREGGDLQEIELKLDPGSKTTGIALVANFKNRGKTLVWSANLNHRGHVIQKNLETRRKVRRSRRFRKTPYRKARFLNRVVQKGWFPPSLLSRVNNVLTWTKRLRKACPLGSIEVETVRFDTQKLENAEISGIEYQQGELEGYEVREYLLEKYRRTCVYCKKVGVALEIEHVIPKSRGGSDRVSNLTIACRKCNEEKGNKSAKEFGFPEVEKQCKKPLKDAVAVNATRYKIGEELKRMGLRVGFWSGGRTKRNRVKQGYEKEHWIDAVCVGESGGRVGIEKGHRALEIRAVGRGSRQMCLMDKHGFPRSKAKSRKKCIHGFQTGDLVKALVPKGKKRGEYKGKVMVRASGSFDIKTKGGVVSGIAWRHCKILQKLDGYAYFGS